MNGLPISDPTAAPVVHPIGYLEMLITHQCNLHCDGCANYGNYGLKDQMSFEDNREYIRLWSRRISPGMFRILGGEPTIHPNLIDYVRLAHEVWPQANRVVVTNGAFLHRQPALLETMIETGSTLHLSFHSNDPKYLEWIKPILTLIKMWTAQGLKFDYADYRIFRRQHRGMGPSMRPFEDNDALGSISRCPSNHCRNLARGRLWKCPPIEGLRTTLRKFGLENSPEWAPYLAYEGIGLDASDEEMQAFLTRGPEEICKMCPKTADAFAKDIYNKDWTLGAERFAWQGEPIDVRGFVDSIIAA